MNRVILAAALAIAALPAAAQQPPTPPPSVEQRIATQIGSLIIQVTNQAVQIENLQASLVAAQARVKELEAAPPPQEAPK
jgi:hypothetical protein